MNRDRKILLGVCGIVLAVGTLITCALWLGLTYLVLQQIHADNLTWFIFWIYVPLSTGITVLAQYTNKLIAELKT